jgi:hypothetical protein
VTQVVNKSYLFGLVHMAEMDPISESVHAVIFAVQNGTQLLASSKGRKPNNPHYIISHNDMGNGGTFAIPPTFLHRFNVALGNQLQRLQQKDQPSAERIRRMSQLPTQCY